MTQSLLNLSNSPLAIGAALLWVILLWLVLRRCQLWIKERNKEQVIQKNHPSIPVKVYQLSDFTEEPKLTHKPVIRKATLEQSAPPNVWDV